MGADKLFRCIDRQIKRIILYKQIDLKVKIYKPPRLVLTRYGIIITVGTVFLRYYNYNSRYGLPTVFQL